MSDPVDEFRQLVRQRAVFGLAAGAARPLVVVGGGRRGVGTTTVGVNLAVALARQGRRAVFVDADLEHGGGLQCGSHGGGSVVDVLSGRRGVHEVLQRGPSGIQVLSGAGTARDANGFSAVAQGRLIADLTHLAPHAEVVVVDAGNSRSAFARRCWQAANAVVVVTTPEDAAVTQCYASIKVLLAGGTTLPIHTFVNLADDVAIAANVGDRLSAACRRFLGVRTIVAGFAGQCPVESRHPAAVFSPRSEASDAIDRAADAVWAQLQLGTTRAAGLREHAVGV